MGLKDFIDPTLHGEYSRSTGVEILLTGRRKRPILNMLDLRESIIVICWYIWWQQREIVTGVLLQILRTLHLPSMHWYQINPGCSRKINRENSPLAEYWGIILCRRFGCCICVVLRSDQDEAVAGSASLLDHVLDATSAEGLALPKGLEWLDKFGVSKAIIELDSLELI
jgi:hypothetical protein